MLLRYREIWPFLIGKLITDPVWWFYLFWLPVVSRPRTRPECAQGRLLGRHDLRRIVDRFDSRRLAVGHLIKRGWTVGKARMTTMGLAAIFMPSSIVAYYAESFVVCVAFISLATACHQAWSANLFTNATDLFPQKVSGSVVGLGATAGGIGGMFMTLLVGLAVQWTGTQQIAFVLAGVMHLIALRCSGSGSRRSSCRSMWTRRLDTRAMHAGSRSRGAVVVLAAASGCCRWSASSGTTSSGIVKFSGALQAARLRRRYSD